MDSFKRGSLTRNSIDTLSSTRSLVLAISSQLLKNIPQCWNHSKTSSRSWTKKGHIDEEQYNIHGIRMDKDINGQIVFRTAGIVQESFQCSKCLTRFHQVNIHLERLRIIKSKETEKKATANMKHDELVQANKIVEFICSKLLHDGIIDEGAEFCEEHMQLCLMKIFSKLKNP
jgi:hypothetical protein